MDVFFLKATPKGSTGVRRHISCNVMFYKILMNGYLASNTIYLKRRINANNGKLLK